MKISKTLIWALLPSLFSCSQVDLEATGSSYVSHAFENQLHRGSEAPVANELNPYDVAGSINTDLYNAYEQRHIMNYTLGSIIDTLVVLGNGDSRFSSLSPISYQFNQWSLLDELVVPNDSILRSVINDAVSDSNLRESFHDFIFEITANCIAEESQAAIYAKITAFEADVVGDTGASENDKEVVLTTTSILRQCVCRVRKRAKKNTDRDWDLMITTMRASVEGSTRSKQDAIILTLVTELSLSQ